MKKTLAKFLHGLMMLACVLQINYASAQEGEDTVSISDYMHNKVIFFIGYPGSGKGTQGKKIAEMLNISHLSTGELFRAEAKKQTPIGLEMDYYMQRGEIIPKEITFQYLRQELADPKYRNGFILDGYPKNLECCEFILQTLSDLQYEPVLAVHFEIARDEVVRRLSGRLHCKECEKDYHVEFLPPQVEGVCDVCKGSLESRKDDSPDAINNRLDVFEQNTQPVINRFAEVDLLVPINAVDFPEVVTQQIIKTIAERREIDLYYKGSYYLRPPAGGIENSAVFHNHIDAESDELLREIVGKIESRSLLFQNKIYPINYLHLGKQVWDSQFRSVYKSLPNFHAINDSVNESFSTGKMGEDGFNYDQVRATLEVASEYTQKGVMTELEEDIFEMSFDVQGTHHVALDKGNTPYAIDWEQLPGWQEKQIKKVPAFELHHGFDIKKLPGELSPPLNIALLTDLTADKGFNNGGWFIFRKDGYWAYRSNEFSNASYEESILTLNQQALKLRGIVDNFLQGREYTSSCSMEKVHAMWRM